ncbi:hypothetical protein J437_LFUL013525, partial [Ladona fulva]
TIHCRPKLGVGWKVREKIVCYYGSWATYRQGNGQFNVDNIDPNLCTHLIYSFVGIGNDGSVVNNPTLRNNFVSNIISFVRQYNFDGFDLDWEYPAQNGGSPSDKGAFTLLIQQLRPQFDKYGYSLSAAIPAGKNSIQTSYDICTMIKNGGWITKWDDQQKVPYAYSGNQWISFDNPQSVALKVNYALQQGLGGVMTWSIDTDDFLGLCTGKKFPILNAMRGILGDENNSQTSPIIPPPITTIPTLKTTTQPSQTQTCAKEGYVRDMSNCAKFYYCQLINNKYTAHTYNCPAGLVFDTNNSICNYPDMVNCLKQKSQNL